MAQTHAPAIAALPILTEPRVLEIGCGTGFLTEALREQELGGDWLITDLAAAMLVRAQARLRTAQTFGRPPRLTFARLHGEHETPPAGLFDLICGSLATNGLPTNRQRSTACGGGSRPAARSRWRR